MGIMSMTARQKRLMEERKIREQTRKKRYKLGMAELKREASRMRCFARYQADPEKEKARVRACQRAAAERSERVSGQLTLLDLQSPDTAPAAARG
jgi:hypothetical protein